MAEFASKGVAGTGLGLGIAGTALGVLSGGLGNMLGGILTPGQYNTAMAQRGCCSEDHLVNRYEAGQAGRIAELETQVKLLEANTYTDQKSLALYQYIDGQFKDIRAELCAQAVHNQRTEDSFALASRDLMAVKAELQGQIALEAERRCCGDNSIVNYVNATFYPVNVADVTVGTTTTAQTRYNPIPQCGCCNG
jgi:hypothetical protein